VEAGPDDGGTKQRELGFQRQADRAREPGGRLHDDVDEKRAASQPDLVALAFQVGERGLDLADRAGADPAPAVEHPVDRGLGQARLNGDLADPERMRGHGVPGDSGDGFLTGFCG
jgi:hypothetical protein